MNRRQGFSLVDALIGAAVLVVGLLALISVFPIASDNTVASAGHTPAVALGPQQIERLRNMAFPPGGGSDAQLVGGIVYTRTWSVAVTGSPPDRMATVSVSVTWPGRGGRVDLATMIAE
jgi:Tfp pilus assembly protein PilV